MTVADAVVRSTSYGLLVILEEAPFTLSHQSTSSHHSGIVIDASNCAALRLGAIGSKRGERWREERDWADAVVHSARLHMAYL